jgi:HD domain-containing protein/GAF domain-containing protein
VSALEVVLLAVAGWVALSVLTVLVLLPLFRVARLAERPVDRFQVEAPETSPESFSLLRESGYLGIVLERLVLHASTVFDADQVCVFGRDARARDDGLVLVQGAGVSPDLIGRPLDIDWDPMVAALACGRPLAVPGHLWPAWDAGHGSENGVRSAAIAPVWFGGRLQGAVSLTHHGHGHGLDMAGLGRLGDLAELVGQALAHTVGRQLSAADPQPEIDGLLEALARTAPECGRLGAEVAWVARRLAEELGIGGPDLLELELGARLHRVGRLRMPSSVIRTRLALTQPERELLRLEPLWGAEMVACIPGLEAVALIVRHSRESWDGLGYPDALAGEEIPLASRIIAVSEAFCSMSLGELDELAGTSFDPDLAARLAGLASAAEVRPGV